MSDRLPEFSATRTVNFEYEIDFGPDPWYGRLLGWLDEHVNHPVVLFGGWQEYLPERLATWLVWPAYRFCSWTCERWHHPWVIPKNDAAREAMTEWLSDYKEFVKEAEDERPS